MINESIVARVIMMKFLEVHLDENLTWKTHLTSISIKRYMFLPLIKNSKIFSMLQLSDFYIKH